ncbi:MAG TPA: FmdB family zinc ribbon protein [Acidimicrobiales bacterium]|nr:FmdB family zinc ribbon protein [Acidimicrobiales bacterium]
MPTYEYACRECGRHLEVVQSFADEPLTVCPSCDGPLRKVFGTIGIAFKGSGFYKTDSRGSSSSKTSSSAPSSEGSAASAAPSTSGDSGSTGSAAAAAASGSGSGSGPGSSSTPSAAAS